VRGISGISVDACIAFELILAYGFRQSNIASIHAVARYISFKHAVPRLSLGTAAALQLSRVWFALIIYRTHLASLAPKVRRNAP
jgi:hypothetical protein